MTPSPVPVVRISTQQTVRRRVPPMRWEPTDREAVCLADRVILFSRNPGQIREQFDIPLPRPRDINSIALAEHAGKITAALKGHLEGEVAE